MRRRLLGRKGRNGVAAAAALFLVALLGLRLLGDDAEPPVDTEPEHVQVVLASRLESGTRFSVRYEALDPFDDDSLHPPVSLSLQRDGEYLYTLTTGDAPAVHPTQPGGVVGIPSILLGGPGPYEFTLPKLEQGTYQLCSSVGLDVPSTSLIPRRQEKFCRTVEVVGG